jgi:hypothetical protein
VAAVPPGQPGVPVPGDGPGQEPPARRLTVRRALVVALVVALPALIALRIATFSGVVGIDAVDEVVRVALAATLLFGVCGFGVVRLWLPEALRRHELLWILPTGACASGMAMTPLGFLRLPFTLNLALVLAGGLALSVHAVRRHGLPARPELRTVAWPAYIGALLFAIALVPLFRSGLATVTGDGSDAHLAAGTGEFLRNASPQEIDASLPVDQVPLVWESKHAIYYAFGAVSSLAGLETYETLSILSAFLLALAGVGMYVLAREMFVAGVGTATAAMAITGLDRMVLHTGIHPYFNQTWGYMALPFSIVLSWWVIGHPSRRGWALLGLFLLLCAFAYPLAVPIPLWVLGVMWWMDRRARRRRGEPVTGRRELWARFRSLPRKVRWPAYFVAFLLIVPVWGVIEKMTQGSQVLLDPRNTLQQWGGDLVGFYPERQFFAIHEENGWWIYLIVILGFCVWQLRRLPPGVRAGLLSLVVVTGLIAGSMRMREYGWYFHFKVLAFVAPLIIVAAVVAMRKVPRVGLVLLAIWGGWAIAEARDEVSTTFDQLPATILDLRGWSAALEPGESVRLDMQPAAQLWVAYMFADHPLCSQRPISDTSYPHVPLSRAADYVLVRGLRKPFDAVGEPVRRNKELALYRLADGLPGGDRCSQRMVQTVVKIEYVGKR